MLFPLRFGERTLIFIITCFILSLASIGVIFTVYFLNTHQSLPFGLTTATTTAFVQHEHQRQFGMKEVTSTIAEKQQPSRLPNLTATHHYHRKQSTGHQNSAPIELYRNKYGQNNRLKEDVRRQNLRLKPKMPANEESKARIDQAVRTTANSRNDVFAVDDVTEMSDEESNGQQSASSGVDTIYIDDYDRLVNFNRAENRKMGEAVPDASLDDVNQIDYFDSIIKDHKERVPSVVVTETPRKEAKRRKLTQSSNNVTRSKTKGGRRQHPSGKPGRPAKGQRKMSIVEDDEQLRSFQLFAQGKRNHYYVDSGDRNSASAELINNDLIGGSGSGDFIDDDEDGPEGDTEVYISVDGNSQRNLYSVLKGGSSLSFSLNQPVVTTSSGQTISPTPFRITGGDVPTSDRMDLALNISRRHQWMPPPPSLSPLTTIASNIGALTPTTTSTSHGGSVGNLNFYLKPSVVVSGNISSSGAAELTVSPQQLPAIELSPYNGYHQNSGAWLETRARRIMGNVKKSEERSRQLLLCAEAGGGELCRMLFKGHLNE